MQWVRVAYENRTAVACPLDKVCVTRRASDVQVRNSWAPLGTESCGRYWLEHAAGSAGGGVGLPAQNARYYSSGSRRVSVLPSGAILMAPITLEAEEEGGGAGEEGKGGEGAAAAATLAAEEADPSTTNNTIHPAQPPQRAGQKQPLLLQGVQQNLLE